MDEESSKVPRTKEKTARGSKPKAKPKESVSRTLIAHIPEQNMKEKSKIRRAVKRPSKAEAVKVRVKVDGKYVSDKSTVSFIPLDSTLYLMVSLSDVFSSLYQVPREGCGFS